MTASWVIFTCADRAMVHSSMEIQDRIDECLMRFNQLPFLCKRCQTDGMHSYCVSVGDLVMMTTASAVVEVYINPPELRLHSVRDCGCMDKRTKAHLMVPIGIFERVIRKSKSLYLANVCLDPLDDPWKILAWHPQSVVIGDDISRTVATDDLLVGELCAGGFSGWQHAQHVCKTLGMCLKSSFAVEIDYDICKVFQKTWDEAYIIRNRHEFDEYHETDGFPVFATDLQDMWWISCAGEKNVDVLTMSAPCPPWSDASSGKGLHSQDGWTTINAFLCAMLLKPKVIVMENVSAIRRHPHWQLIRSFINKCGYLVCHEESVNMSSISPQNRERLLLMIIRKDMGIPPLHKIGKFPKFDLKSMFAFQAIQSDLEGFEDLVKISSSVLAMYMDSQFLPKCSGSKKQKLDVASYRIRSIHDAFGCIMACYTSQHEFNPDNLRQRGLFGNVLQQGGQLRFLTGPECAVLMMPGKDMFIPSSRQFHMRIIGNAITSGHAAYILAFAFRTLGVVIPECIDPPSLVAEVMKSRLHFGNSVVIPCDDGWWIRKVDHETVCNPCADMLISPTIRERSFIKVQIFSGDWFLHGFCEREITSEELVGLFGVESSMIKQNHRTDDRITIQVERPFLMPLTNISWHDTKSKYIMSLYKGGFVIFTRAECQNVLQMRQIIQCEVQVLASCQFVHQICGKSISDEEPLPAICILLSREIDEGIRWHFALPVFQQKSGQISCMIDQSQSTDFVCCLKAKGITDFCAIFGWIIDVSCYGTGNPIATITFRRTLDDFVLTTDVFKSVLALWMIQMILPPDVAYMNEGSLTMIKYYGSLIWKGWIPNDWTVEMISGTWTRVADAFSIDCPIRSVIHGMNRRGDELICDFRNPTDAIVRVHWVLPCHGGGNKDETRFLAKNKLASLLLQHGVPIGAVSEYVEKVVNGISPGKLLHEIGSHGSANGWVEMKNWLNKMDFPVPPSNSSFEKAALKIQQAIRKKKVNMSVKLNASQLKIIPDHFLKHDGTPAVVLQTLFEAKSGVILCDPADAEPWVNGPCPLSQDSLACIVLGHHCSCLDPSKCFKTTVPVKDHHDEPIVVAACLHQLGKVDIVTPKDLMTDILVEKSTIVGFTIFRDECDPELWHHVTQSPVKTMLSILDDDLPSGFLASSPWGRSWRNDKEPATPDSAKSFQCHARVKDAHLGATLSVSGRYAIYTTPKSDDKGILPGWAIIWMKQSKKESQIAVTSVGIKHAGFVRSLKGVGIRVKQDAFGDAFQKLRPSDKVPSSISAKYMYKLQPLPAGAGPDLVEQFTKKNHWETRAVRAIGQNAWLVASAVECPKVWMGLNGKLVLAKHMHSGDKQQKPIVLAGSVPNPKVMSVENGPHDPWTSQANDPWANYQSQSKNHGNFGKASSLSMPSSSISPDPSIAKKLQDQDKQIASLQESVKDLTVLQQKAELSHQKAQIELDTKVTKLKTDVADQMNMLSSTFQSSLSQALAKQDAQINAGFQDLKNLFLSNQREKNEIQPNKRTKGNGKGVGTGQDQMHTGSDAEMGASPLRSG